MLQLSLFERAASIKMYDLHERLCHFVTVGVSYAYHFGTCTTS